MLKEAIFSNAGAAVGGFAGLCLAGPFGVAALGATGALLGLYHGARPLGEEVTSADLALQGR